MPRIVPNVLYDDPSAALEWLAKAFGFETRMARCRDPTARSSTRSMEIEDSALMMSPTAQTDPWRSPKVLGGAVTQSLYIYIDDVDGHFERARDAGATIVAEPEEMFWGDRTYVAEDLEGHRWTFAEAVRDGSPDAMKPPA